MKLPRGCFQRAWCDWTSASEEPNDGLLVRVACHLVEVLPAVDPVPRRHHTGSHGNEMRSYRHWLQGGALAAHGTRCPDPCHLKILRGRFFLHDDPAAASRLWSFLPPAPNATHTESPLERPRTSSPSTIITTCSLPLWYNRDFTFSARCHLCFSFA